jgi:hypothetical protein
MSIAKVIWKRTRYHVHSAVLASSLYHSPCLSFLSFFFFFFSLLITFSLTKRRYRYLSHKAIHPDKYLENAKWFGDEALRLLDCLDYEDAKEVKKGAR